MRRWSVFWPLIVAFLAPIYALQTYIQGKKLSLPGGVITITNGNYEIMHEMNQIKYNLRIFDGSNGVKQATLGVTGGSSDADELVKRLIIKILQDNKGSSLLDIYDENGEVMSEVTANLDYNTNVSTGELVNFVTDECAPLCTLSRSIIHKYNLLHCGIGCLIFNNQGDELFVHKRSKHKRLFPSMLDMFIGGVCSSGESPEVTLLRELAEEVGLDYISTKTLIIKEKSTIKAKPSIWNSNNAFARAWDVFKTSKQYDELFSSGTSDYEVIEGDEGKVKYLGRCTIYTSYNHCIVYVYAATTPMSQVVTFKDGEIDEGEYMNLNKLKTLVVSNRDEFVPDGLQVWKQLPILL